MKKVFALIAAVAILAASITAGIAAAGRIYQAGIAAGVRHVFADGFAWLEGDEEGCTGFVIVEVDGKEYKIAAF